MNIENILGQLIRGAISGKKKKHRGALSYLTGGTGRSLLGTGTLLGAAGLAWGLYETWQNQKTSSGTPASAAAPTAGAGTPAGLAPPAPAQRPAVGGTLPATDESFELQDLPPEALRLLRLAISAAAADGKLADSEQERILEHARQVGATLLVHQELQSPWPLARIVAGVSDPRQKEILYALAFSMVRADESVSTTERIYLAQLGHLLELDNTTIQRIEAESAAAIDQAAKEVDSGIN